MSGLAGSFSIDAAVSIAACILLGLFLYWIPGGGFGKDLKAIEPHEPLLQQER
jgi:hypothetical protein